MSQTFAISVHGGRAVADHLKRMGDRGTDFKPVFDDLIAAFLRGERKIWSNQGGFRGKRWPDDAKVTIARKVARGLNTAPMHATGATERALTQPGAPGQIAELLGGTTLIFGVRGVGANVAQYTKDRRHREVVRLLPSTRKEIRQIILDHIIEERRKGHA